MCEVMERRGQELGGFEDLLMGGERIRGKFGNWGQDRGQTIFKVHSPVTVR